MVAVHWNSFGKYCTANGRKCRVYEKANVWFLKCKFCAFVQQLCVPCRLPPHSQLFTYFILLILSLRLRTLEGLKTLSCSVWFSGSVESRFCLFRGILCCFNEFSWQKLQFETKIISSPRQTLSRYTWKTISVRVKPFKLSNSVNFPNSLSRKWSARVEI